MTQPVISLKGVNAWYGESHVLHDMSFDVVRGECVTLLGRNGAGKTTTLRSILGLVHRRSGNLELFGRQTVGWPTYKIAQLGMGYCPEERGIFSSLTCEENLLLPPRLAGEGAGMAMPIEEIYEIFPNLHERRKSQGTKLSGGEQQMLALARILRTGASVLLLDEISEGLAPVIVQTLSRAITKLITRGFTILLVEQNFGFAAPLSDRMLVVEHGTVVETINRSDLAAKMPRVHELLGV